LIKSYAKLHFSLFGRFLGAVGGDYPQSYPQLLWIRVVSLPVMPATVILPRPLKRFFVTSSGRDREQ